MNQSGGLFPRVNNANGEPARADSPFGIQILLSLIPGPVAARFLDQRFADRLALLDEPDLANLREASSAGMR